MNTIYADNDARTIALEECAQGPYQRALLLGEARWSGADLRGYAARWSVRYKLSRASLLARLRERGLTVIEIAGHAGRRIVAIGSSPFGVSVTYRAHSAEIRLLEESETSQPIVSRRQPLTRVAGVVRTYEAAH